MTATPDHYKRSNYTCPKKPIIQPYNCFMMQTRTNSGKLLGAETSLLMPMKCESFSEAVHSWCAETPYNSLAFDW